MKLKTTSIFISFLVILASCNSDNEIGASDTDSSPEIKAFIESFKTISFCKCLEYGSENSLRLSENDASCRLPDYLYGEGNIIDSAAKIVAKKIILDSADRQGQVAEGMEGRRTVGKCLEYFHSQELDSLAKSRYNLYNNRSL